jgi:hypothetical protein
MHTPTPNSGVGVKKTQNPVVEEKEPGGGIPSCHQYKPVQAMLLKDEDVVQVRYDPTGHCSPPTLSRAVRPAYSLTPPSPRPSGRYGFS